MSEIAEIKKEKDAKLHVCYTDFNRFTNEDKAKTADFSVCGCSERNLDAC